MKRKFVLFMWGLASAIVAYTIFKELGTGIIGPHGGIVAGMLLGLFPGSVFGISLADKIIYREEKWNRRNIVQAFLFGFGGLLIGSWLLETNGRWIWFLPAIAAFASLCGYYFKKPSKHPGART